MIRLSTDAPDFEPAFLALLAQARETTEQVDDAVAAIIAEVRAGGDAALCDLTQRFDHMTVTPDRLRIGVDEIEAAVAVVPPDVSNRMNPSVESRVYVAPDATVATVSGSALPPLIAVYTHCIVESCSGPTPVPPHGVGETPSLTLIACPVAS